VGKRARLHSAQLRAQAATSTLSVLAVVGEGRCWLVGRLEQRPGEGRPASLTKSAVGGSVAFGVGKALHSIRQNRAVVPAFFERATRHGIDGAGHKHRVATSHRKASTTTQRVRCSLGRRRPRSFCRGWWARRTLTLLARARPVRGRANSASAACRIDGDGVGVNTRVNRRHEFVNEKEATELRFALLHPLNLVARARKHFANSPYRHGAPCHSSDRRHPFANARARPANRRCTSWEKFCPHCCRAVCRVVG
jgi:hypothetical protein